VFPPDIPARPAGSDRDRLVRRDESAAAGEQLTSRPTATAPVVDSTELDAPVVKKSLQSIPMVQRITDRLSRWPAGWQFRQLRFEPEAQFSTQRLALGLASGLTGSGIFAVDIGLDCVECAGNLPPLPGRMKARQTQDIDLSYLDVMRPRRRPRNNSNASFA
jgi:hypothetical protein